LLRYHAGMLCAACDPKPKFITYDDKSDSYSLNIHENVCNRIMYDCFQYLVESQITG